MPLDPEYPMARVTAGQGLDNEIRRPRNDFEAAANSLDSLVMRAVYLGFSATRKLLEE